MASLLNGSADIRLLSLSCSYRDWFLSLRTLVPIIQPTPTNTNLSWQGQYLNGQSTRILGTPISQPRTFRGDARTSAVLGPIGMFSLDTQGRQRCGGGPITTNWNTYSVRCQQGGEIRLEFGPYLLHHCTGNPTPPRCAQVKSSHFWSHNGSSLSQGTGQGNHIVPLCTGL